VKPRLLLSRAILEIQIAGLNPPIREAQITEREGFFDLNTRASLRAADSRTRIRPRRFSIVFLMAPRG